MNIASTPKRQVAIFNRLEADSLVAAAFYKAATGNSIYEIDQLVLDGLNDISLVHWLGVFPTKEVLERLSGVNHLVFLGGPTAYTSVHKSITIYSHEFQTDPDLREHYSSLSVTEKLGAYLENVVDATMPITISRNWLAVGQLAVKFDEPGPIGGSEDKKVELLELALAYKTIQMAYQSIYAGRPFVPVCVSIKAIPEFEKSRLVQEYLQEYRKAAGYLTNRSQEIAVPLKTGLLHDRRQRNGVQLKSNFVYAVLVDLHDETWYIAKRLMAMTQTKWVFARLHMSDVALRTNIEAPLSKKDLTAKVILQKS